MAAHTCRSRPRTARRLVAHETAPVAHAHATLVRSSPENGSEERRPPAVVQLFFSETVEPKLTEIQVRNQDGDRVDEDDTIVDSDDRSHRVCGRAHARSRALHGRVQQRLFRRRAPVVGHHPVHRPQPRRHRPRRCRLRPRSDRRRWRHWASAEQHRHHPEVDRAPLAWPSASVRPCSPSRSRAPPRGSSKTTTTTLPPTRLNHGS